MSSRLAGLALAATLLGGGCALVVRPEEPAAEAPRADEQARLLGRNAERIYRLG